MAISIRFVPCIQATRSDINKIERTAIPNTFERYRKTPHAEASKKMPKVGMEVSTPEGKAFVVSQNMLKMQVKVKMDDKNGGWIYKDYPVEGLYFKKPAQQEKEDLDDGDDEL